MTSERRGGDHDDSGSIASTPYQPDRNTSHPSSPATLYTSTPSQVCTNVNKSSVNSSSLTPLSSDTHKERDASCNSQLHSITQESSGIRRESIQGRTNPSHSSGVAHISSGSPQELESPRTLNVQMSSSSGIGAVPQISSARSPLRRGSVPSSGTITRNEGHSVPIDQSEPIVLSSQDDDTDDDVFYVPDTPPRELSPKRGRYSQEEITVSDLYMMFSNLPRSTIDCVIDVAENARKVFNILLSGIKTFPLLAEMSKRLDGHCNTITVSQESILSDGVAYYKKPSLDMTCPIMLKYKDMPAMDAGGPGRQFFCDLLKEMKELSILEGPPTRLYPVYSSAVQASEMLRILGRVIVHSLLHEGPGFPFLNHFVFWYLVSGSADVAVNYVLVSDLHQPVAEMINKV